jgi:aryl-alcohol dehydrogenase-like predicted oxidoreductase
MAMQYRTFGRTGWQVAEIGYGMWGMGGWTGSEDSESLSSLQLSVDLGCNFFDTAYAYGEGHSERLLGRLLKANPGKTLYTATKIPPKNRIWPSRRGAKLDDVFPADYIREQVEKSLTNLGTDHIDMMQFHVWEDDWARDERWQRAVQDLTQQGKVRAWGVSVNRWEPDNCLETLRTGLIDAVQVIYNVFDQAPEDNLYPLSDELKIAIIARVPFDEGTLTGTLTKDSKWPEGDWRNTYFVPENLNASVDRAEALRPLIPAGMTMPELALRFILANPTVSTIIPGMRKESHVRANIAASDGKPLPASLLAELKKHRWDRKPTKGHGHAAQAEGRYRTDGCRAGADGRAAGTRRAVGRGSGCRGGGAGRAAGAVQYRLRVPHAQLCPGRASQRADHELDDRAGGTARRASGWVVPAAGR